MSAIGNLLMGSVGTKVVHLAKCLVAMRRSLPEAIPPWRTSFVAKHESEQN